MQLHLEQTGLCFRGGEQDWLPCFLSGVDVSGGAQPGDESQRYDQQGDPDQNAKTNGKFGANAEGVKFFHAQQVHTSSMPPWNLHGALFTFLFRASLLPNNGQ